MLFFGRLASDGGGERRSSSASSRSEVCSRLTIVVDKGVCGEEIEMQCHKERTEGCPAPSSISCSPLTTGHVQRRGLLRPNKSERVKGTLHKPHVAVCVAAVTMATITENLATKPHPARLPSPLVVCLPTCPPVMPSLEDRKSIVVSSSSSASSPPYSPSETSSRGPAPKPRGRPRKSPSTPRKRSSTSTSHTSRPIERQGKAAGSTGGRSGLGVGMGSTHEGRRTGPWTKEEVRALADAVIVIPASGVSLARLASAGRILTPADRRALG